RELNGYYATINRQAAGAGNQAYTSFYKVGITAQQGIVDGLLKDKAAIEKAANQLANLIQRATSRKLRGKATTQARTTAVTRTTSARAVLAATPVARPTTPTNIINLHVTAPVGS